LSDACGRIAPGATLRLLSEAWTMSEPLKIERVLHCEWWVLRAAYQAIANKIPPGIDDYHGVFTQGGWSLITGGDEYAGYLSLNANDDKSSETKLFIEDLLGNHREYWQAIVKELERFVLRLHEGRRQHAKTAEDIIEIYYRSRAAGSKVTLRELAEQYGFNSKSLSNAKRVYDARGGWGSKVHKPHGQK
jgi:hypothetical protein